MHYGTVGDDGISMAALLLFGSVFIWEKDLFFDDHVGNFTAKKAIGDDIVVKQRKTKK